MKCVRKFFLNKVTYFCKYCLHFIQLNLHYDFHLSASLFYCEWNISEKKNFAYKITNNNYNECGSEYNNIHYNRIFSLYRDPCFTQWRFQKTFSHQLTPLQVLLG